MDFQSLLHAFMGILQTCSELFNWAHPTLTNPWLLFHYPVPVTHMRNFWHCPLPLLSTQMGTAISTAPDPFKLVHCVAHSSVGRRAVDLRLKDLLVSLCLGSHGLSVAVPIRKRYSLRKRDKILRHQYPPRRCRNFTIYSAKS